MSVTIDTSEKIWQKGIYWEPTGEFRPPEKDEAYLNANRYELQFCKKTAMSQSRPIFKPYTENLVQKLLERFKNGNVLPFVKSGYITMNSRESDILFYWHKNKPKYHESCGQWDSSGRKNEVETNYQSQNYRQPTLSYWKITTYLYKNDDNEPFISLEESRHVDASQMCFKV
jgi:hypothetical protein